MDEVDARCLGHAPCSYSGFPSDVLTSPSLQLELSLPILWGKSSSVCPEAQQAWKMERKMAFEAHLLQEAFSD